jgi:hypothetical protein
VRPELSSHQHATVHVIAFHSCDCHLNEAIVEKQVASRIHNVWQTTEAHRHTPLVANNVFRGQNEWISHLQFDRLVGEPADANFGSRQVSQDGDAALRSARGGSDVSNRLSVAVEITMRKINAGNIHAGTNHALYGLNIIGRWAYGADDLSLVARQCHNNP